MLLDMENEEELRARIKKLENDVEYEKIRAQNKADRAEWIAKHQKDKSTEVLAIVLVLLFCSVLIILGLTGVLK